MKSPPLVALGSFALILALGAGPGAAQDFPCPTFPNCENGGGPAIRLLETGRAQNSTSLDVAHVMACDPLSGDPFHALTLGPHLGGCEPQPTEPCPSLTAPTIQTLCSPAVTAGNGLAVISCAKESGTSNIVMTFNVPHRRAVGTSVPVTILLGLYGRDAVLETSNGDPLGYAEVASRHLPVVVPDVATDYAAQLTIVEHVTPPWWTGTYPPLPPAAPLKGLLGAGETENPLIRVINLGGTDRRVEVHSENIYQPPNPQTYTRTSFVTCSL